ncbi:MAG: GntR family transcriptional regulator [Oscillospiraceae bacterium]|nr:GntR family transcriptional regulator [Oscillospiraceae bacterium]
MQLAQSIEDEILSGAFGEETQIPSITEYSVAYKINPATALKGINLLVDRGLVYKKRGIGMFVSAGAREQLLKERRNAFFEQSILPVVLDAKKLDMSLEELQKMIRSGFENGN